MSTQHYALNISGHTIDFYICIDDPLARHRILELEPYFRRLPVQHLGAIFPIFVINLKPGRGESGGAWRHGQVHAAFTGPQQIRNTHAPIEKIKTHVISRGRGLIGIPRNRWERPIDRRHITVMHEVAHSIDFSLGLSPARATAADFDGILVGNECNAGPELERLAAVAYRRFIFQIRLCDRPRPGESIAAGNRRLIDTLRRSPAFSTIPPNWSPP